MGEYTIKLVHAREILDGFGTPTIEVDVITKEGKLGRAAIARGASKGNYEAAELRDGDERYGGMGVRQAVKNVNDIIAPRLKGMDIIRQREIDQIMIEMDKSPNKKNLGANAVLGVSMATTKAAAKTLGIPIYNYLGGINRRILPIPLTTMIGGGEYGRNSLDFEDYLVLFCGFETFNHAVQVCVEIYQELAFLQKKKYGYTPLPGEIYAPPMKSNEEALDTIMEAITKKGYEKTVKLGIDAAASHLYDSKNGTYHLSGRTWDKEDLLGYYEKLVCHYPIVLLEDPFHEDDFDGFAQVTKVLNTVIVGDDLFATNILRLSKGIKQEAGNAILLKINQIGTITEALDTAYLAYQSGYQVIVSARFCETNDTMIADLAVALSAPIIKLGAPVRGERNAKYNRLLRIEDEIGNHARFASLGIPRAQKLNVIKEE